jgi:uncharacterized membrane protein
MTMSKILAAIGVAVVAGLPASAIAADYGCTSVRLKCSGFEPNWALRLSAGGTLRFTDPENTNGGVPPIIISACATRLPGNKISVTAGAPLGLSATVTNQTCTDPSGQTRPRSISITYTQGAAGGTATPISGNGCCN